MAKPKAGAIDPDRLYKIEFSKTITDGNGKKYIPRAGATVKVRGRILETIKSEVDGYEEV
jgi:hypothetical protein